MWKFFVSLIPPRIRITSKVTYEVVYIKEFKDSDIMGETRHWSKQIVLGDNQTDKEKIETLIHELIHAISDENDLGITETQVHALEKGIIKLLTLNKFFDFFYKLLYTRKKGDKQ